MIKKDRVLGVWKHKHHGWEIAFVHRGRKRSEYRISENEALKRKEYWEQTIKTETELGSQPSVAEHTVDFWERRLRDCADYVIDTNGAEDALATAKAVAALAAVGMKVASHRPPPPVDENSQQISGDAAVMTDEEIQRHIAQMEGK